jgi:hypothetical protein
LAYINKKICNSLTKMKIGLVILPSLPPKFLIIIYINSFSFIKYSDKHYAAGQRETEHCTAQEEGTNR